MIKKLLYITSILSLSATQIGRATEHGGGKPTEQNAILNSINTNLGSIDNKLDKLNNLNTNLGNIEKALTQATSPLNTTLGNINNELSKLNDLNTNLGNIEKALTQATSPLNTTLGNINNELSKLDDLNTNMSNIDGKLSKLDDLNTNLDNIKKALADPNNVSGDNLNENLKALTGKLGDTLNALNDNLNKKLKKLNNNLGNLDSNLDKQQTNMNKTLTDLNGNLNTQQTNINKTLTNMNNIMDTQQNELKKLRKQFEHYKLMKRGNGRNGNNGNDDILDLINHDINNGDGSHSGNGNGSNGNNGDNGGNGGNGGNGNGGNGSSGGSGGGNKWKRKMANIIDPASALATYYADLKHKEQSNKDLMNELFDVTLNNNFMYSLLPIQDINNKKKCWIRGNISGLNSDKYNTNNVLIGGDIFNKQLSQSLLKLQLFGGTMFGKLENKSSDYNTLDFLIGPKLSLLHKYFVFEVLGLYRYDDVKYSKSNKNEFTSNIFNFGCKLGFNIGIANKFVLHPYVNVLVSKTFTSKPIKLSNKYQVNWAPGLAIGYQVSNSAHIIADYKYNFKPIFVNNKGIDLMNSPNKKGSNEFGLGVNKSFNNSIEFSAKIAVNVSKNHNINNNKKYKCDVKLQVQLSKSF